MAETDLVGKLQHLITKAARNSRLKKIAIWSAISVGLFAVIYFLR